MLHQKCAFLCLSNISKECSTIKPVKKSQAKIDAPAKAKAPLSETHPKRILLALQEEQEKTKKLENVIARMQKEISSKSITINSSIADDIEEVMNKNLNIECITIYETFLGTAEILTKQRIWCSLSSHNH